MCVCVPVCRSLLPPHHHTQSAPPQPMETEVDPARPPAVWSRETSQRATVGPRSGWPKDLGLERSGGEAHTCTGEPQKNRFKTSTPPQKPTHNKSRTPMLDPARTHRSEPQLSQSSLLEHSVTALTYYTHHYTVWFGRELLSLPISHMYGHAACHPTYAHFCVWSILVILQVAPGWCRLVRRTMLYSAVGSA